MHIDIYIGLAQRRVNPATSRLKLKGTVPGGLSQQKLFNEEHSSLKAGSNKWTAQHRYWRLIKHSLCPVTSFKTHSLLPKTNKKVVGLSRSRILSPRRVPRLFSPRPCCRADRAKLRLADVRIEIFSVWLYSVITSIHPSFLSHFLFCYAYPRY